MQNTSRLYKINIKYLQLVLIHYALLDAMILLSVELLGSGNTNSERLAKILQISFKSFNQLIEILMRSSLKRACYPKIPILEINIGKAK